MFSFQWVTQILSRIWDRTYVDSNMLAMLLRLFVKSQNIVCLTIYRVFNPDIAQLVRVLDSAILVTSLIPNEHIPLISDIELWNCSTNSYMQTQAAYSLFTWESR